MKLEYTLSTEDILAAHRLRKSQNLIVPKKVIICSILCAISYIGFFVSTHYHFKDFAWSCASLCVGAFITPIAKPFLVFYKTRRSAGTLFLKSTEDIARTIQIDEEHIHSTFSGVTEKNVLWSDVRGFVQDERILMFITNEDGVFIFPTRAMTPAQRAELNDLVARHVTRKKS